MKRSITMPLRKRALCLAVAAAALSGGGIASLGGAAAETPPQRSGSTLYQQRCAVCHGTPKAGVKSGVGPNLAGVVGRKAGTVPGFAYSKAMKADGRVWNAASLNKYLEAPTREIPGSRMVLRVANPQDRAAIADYLAAQR